MAWRAAASGFFEPVALLPAKGQHAVQVGHIGGGVLRLQGQAQHGGRVAAVEAGGIARA